MKKILLVDDDADLREAMKTVLSTQYEVSEAGSKAEGLAAVGKVNPNLIILDVMMETDSAGFELAREIRADDMHKNIRLLMLTGVDNEKGINFKEVAGDVAWLPVDDYIVKPAQPQELLKKVASLIDA